MPRTATATKTTWEAKVPQLKPGKYADGMPLHQLHYVCCKLILRPNHFTSRASLFDFEKVLRAPAKQSGVVFTKGHAAQLPVQIREVLFVDTHDFRLYNNAFILRRRIRYEDGFPTGDPEIVFKYRHPDIQKAAEMDVRPHILGDHRVKFKVQALPLKGELGGIRLLYSHNVQFPRSHAAENGALSMGTMSRVFPVLESIRTDPDEPIAFVSNQIIEEVLQDIGSLDFGEGMKARVTISLWRTGGEHRPLIGEFSFQIKFEDRKDLSRDALKRAEEFFIALQYEAEDWFSLDATKTGMVYRLNGNAPASHE